MVAPPFGARNYPPTMFNACVRARTLLGKNSLARRPNLDNKKGDVRVNSVVG
jgi:hypothetical protein